MGLVLILKGVRGMKVLTDSQDSYSDVGHIYYENRRILLVKQRTPLQAAGHVRVGN